jgi:hypothetical protein
MLVLAGQAQVGAVTAQPEAPVGTIFPVGSAPLGTAPFDTGWASAGRPAHDDAPGTEPMPLRTDERHMLHPPTLLERMIDFHALAVALHHQLRQGAQFLGRG